MNSQSIMKWFKILVLSAIFFSCLWSFVWFYNVDAPSEKSGSQKAQLLIDAINIYHQKMGAFPESLQDLVPEYFAKVPKPDWRHEYEYAANEKAFTIAFVPKGEAFGDGWYVYCSSRDEWQGTDSAGWEYVFYDCSE